MAADTSVMTQAPALERSDRTESPRGKVSQKGSQALAARSTRTVAPPVDIYETDAAYVLLADMPGVNPEGLDVTAERGELVIRGRTQAPATLPEHLVGGQELVADRTVAGRRQHQHRGLGLLGDQADGLWGLAASSGR